ncbi:hypothetical protein [Stenotrophomonas sp. 24(2023)]|uniref:hypothetical protein n=1 Tax=Stenotrophomonas sp. 24(2023) TaxID=3068324 RepID=UPI0027E0E968|nr:hypothetical protein [Stenotrophomonas sp. 24(2023)]WMJ68155.1 hypothetical protein Q9R17_13205 [Stenotrophomonas sp. 24(2023)]
MALPAPIATFCQVARRGWPVLAAALLTLLLGWAALHEGRGGPAGAGFQPAGSTAAAVLEGALPGPLPAGEDALQFAACVPEAPADGDAGTPPVAARAVPCTRWVAHVAPWPADALRWHRLEPSLRLNPGHAPPAA